MTENTNCASFSIPMRTDIMWALPITAEGCVSTIKPMSSDGSLGREHPNALT